MFRSFRFLEQFQLDSITDIGDIKAQHILEKIVQDESPAAICGIAFNSTNGVYTCIACGYSDAQFPHWFRKFANTILMAEQDHHK